VAIFSGRRLFRDALAAWLTEQSDLSLVGHVSDDGDDLLDLCRLRSPAVVLVDAGSNVGALARTLSALRGSFPAIRVVVVYERLGPDDLSLASKLGVDALVPYSHGLDALLVVLLDHIRGFQAGGDEHGNSDSALTDEEVEILTLIGSGHTITRIAELLDLTPCAVENAKRRIFAKLRVANQARAIARASALGLVARRLPAQPAADHGDGPVLVLLRGPDTSVRRDAVVAMLSDGISFAIENSGDEGDADAWNRWHKGPVLLVLVDPHPRDWEATRNLPVVLVRSSPVPRAEALNLLARGVVGLIAADRVSAALPPALTLTSQGHIIIDPAVAPSLVAVLRMPGEPDKRLPGLTVREHEMLVSIAQGHTIRETARRLGIAVKTVENTQARLFLKLGTHSRAGAVAAAHRLGLLDLTGEPAGPVASAGPAGPAATAGPAGPAPKPSEPAAAQPDPRQS